MRSKDRIEGTSNEKDSNNNTPYVVGNGQHMQLVTASGVRYK